MKEGHVGPLGAGTLVISGECRWALAVPFPCEPRLAYTEEVIVMMVWFGSHWTFWQSGLMSIAILAFWVLVVWVIYAFITSGPPRTLNRDESPDAQQILDQRLARG